jgi:ketosteroid isomerase-like protein
MSAENVELVERMLELFHSGDADGAIACFSDDVIVDASRRPDGATGRGHEALARIVAEWVGAFEEWNGVIEEMRDHGDEVHVLATQRGRGKGSGVEVEARYAIVYGVRGGKIVSFTLYSDRDTLPA